MHRADCQCVCVWVRVHCNVKIQSHGSCSIVYRTASHRLLLLHVCVRSVKYCNNNIWYRFMTDCVQRSPFSVRLNVFRLDTLWRACTQILLNASISLTMIWQCIRCFVYYIWAGRSTIWLQSFRRRLRLVVPQDNGEKNRKRFWYESSEKVFICVGFERQQIVTFRISSLAFVGSGKSHATQSHSTSVNCCWAALASSALKPFL